MYPGNVVFNLGGQKSVQNLYPNKFDPNYNDMDIKFYGAAVKICFCDGLYFSLDLILKIKFLSSTQLVNIFAVELAIHIFKNWYNLQLFIYIVRLRSIMTL